MARILHVCASSDFARYLDRILPALTAAGHEVHFVSSPGSEPFDLFDFRQIHIHSVELSRNIDLLADLHGLGQLTRLMLSLKPDLVHSHTPKGGLLGMLAARAAGIPARVCQLHGVRYETARGIQRAALVNCERIATSLAQRVVCVSPSVRNRVVSDSIVSAEKSLVLSNGSAQGIDCSGLSLALFESEAAALRSQLGIAPDTRCVVYLGRIARDKGLGELAQAWQHVKRSRAATLVIAGKRDPTDPIDLSILKHDETVRILDHQEAPLPLIALGDIIVLPSYREGLPQVALEAGALGRPIVATRVTGCVDVIVENRTGVLIPPNDPAALSEAILHLLNDKGRRDALGKAAQEWVARAFQPQPIIAAVLNLYDELLEPG